MLYKASNIQYQIVEKENPTNTRNQATLRTEDTCGTIVQLSLSNLQVANLHIED